MSHLGSLEQNREQIIVLYNDGVSISAIGRRLGICRNSIGVFLRKQGIDTADFGRHARKNLNSDQIRDMYESGISASKIAKKLNSSRSTIMKRIREMGLEEFNPLKARIDPKWLSDQYLDRKKSIFQISKESQWSPNVVNRALRDIGIDIRRDSNQKKNFDRDRITRWYQEGLSTQTIANRLGCSASIIRDRLLQWDIEIRSSTRIEMDEERILYLYNKVGMSAQEIADHIGYSHNAIRKRLRENNIVRPSGKFGSVRVFKPHGYPVKFGSGWEARMYQILWRVFGEEGFFFQGEFGDRENRCTSKMELNKPENLPSRYITNKNTYTWHPNFLVPTLGIIEIKGGWRIRQKWNQCIIPCIRATPNLGYSIWVLKSSPFEATSWTDLRGKLELV